VISATSSPWLWLATGEGYCGPEAAASAEFARSRRQHGQRTFSADEQLRNLIMLGI